MTIQVGLIGTGFAAQKRAAALSSDPRAMLVAIAPGQPTLGQPTDSPLTNSPRAQSLSETQGAEYTSWSAIIENPKIQLVMVSTINALHEPIARAALTAQKHVVVEYPLALDPKAAAELIDLATAKNCLLHVEHIELLGGLHLAMRSHLSAIGPPYYLNYRTFNPKHPAPQKWNYRLDLSGFPLIAALSRIHRLTDLFGKIDRVFCQTQFKPPAPPTATGPYYGTCLCSAQLRFQSGLIADIAYGKGEHLWNFSRRVEIQGTQGSLLFDRDQGTLTTADGAHPIPVAPRRGLFTQDTTQVLDHLTTGAPLYVSPAASLYALTVADTLRQSAETGQAVTLPPPA
ncbi:MAG: Gfo/Idh/MocA family oxidoreductase [Cyanobacteria bacterium J06635_1]